MMRMRYTPIVPTVALLLLACGGDPPKEKQEQRAPAMPALKMMAPEELVGYYSGRMPGPEGRWYETTLYIRMDGTYMLLELDHERDSIPRGSIGEWQAVAGGLELDIKRNQRNMRWMAAGNGFRLDMRDADPEAILPKQAGELFEDTPRMRVLGNYRWQDDAQTFQPCGADRVWPAGMGLNAPEDEPVEPAPDLLSHYRDAQVAPGQPLLVEVVGNLGWASSMEDDVPEEYFFVHRLVEVVRGGQCP